MGKPIWPVALGCGMLAAIPAQADLGPWGSSHRPAPPIQVRCIVQPVRSVEQAGLDRGPVLKLSAKGTASTLGSTYPELRFRTVNGARTSKATAVYEFLACQPALAAQVMTPVTAETEVRLPLQYGRIRFIAVKSATNSILLTLDAPRRP